MMRGTIGFATNNKSTISALIRFFTKSQYSHTFVITDVLADRIYLMEANEGGTDFRTFQSDYGNPEQFPTELWDPIASPEEIDRALKATQERFEGVFYGYLEILGIGTSIGLA